jgi:hypothetical protein
MGSERHDHTVEKYIVKGTGGRYPTYYVVQGERRVTPNMASRLKAQTTADRLNVEADEAAKQKRTTRPEV